MSATLTDDLIRQTTALLVTVVRSGTQFEIQVPVTYPDGQMVSVTIEPEAGGRFRVHDISGGVMYFESVGGRPTRAMGERFASEAKHYGCEYTMGRVWRVTDAAHLAASIVMVANASRSIGDQAKELRRHFEVPFRISVAERLKETFGQRVRENAEARGESGRLYHLAAVMLDRFQRAPVAFVEASASRSTVLAHVGQFFDLRSANPDVRNVSVYDDHDKWRKEDLRLLEQVSDLVAYSQTPMRMRQIVAINE